MQICLFISSLFAQDASVIHGVSLRGDPSTKNPPIGHLNKNSTVTLLAAKPKVGFYHVKTSDGTEGWIGVKYLSVGGQAGREATPSLTPGASATGTAASTGCDQSLWDHVYNKTRLAVLQPCATVSGTLHIVRPEPDGDVHMQLTLDPQFNSMLNSINKSKQKGALVIETMCEHTPTQPDAISSCQGLPNPPLE